ncbi:Gfo/Idh/MocA family protein [Halopelagius longus]|uniref:Gfo/Idh/MocA family oxidoreductase n=1 Tax=Halopelagius longus TaxID=1236180 RepID=A0A1H1G3M3_9EURY|nr:Gfo/Idh/MocA family oxidoreductase [Halopelagius longus]RDI69864.1 gfo/Idh/MocA family oxidoreductase [Halopelagius longus]SDR07781.1 Predicted dehydrogenase [Halopelagius longus]
MREIGIVMNGVTGRMGTNQHLIRSILALRDEGGVELPSGERVMPNPLLVGRNERKLRELSEEHGVERWTADPDLESCLEGDDEIYFDSQVTPRRPEALLKAIEAGKDVYCEKPLGTNLDTALEVARAAERSGVKHGIVQDKLWLPGLQKLRRLLDQGFFGEVLSVDVDFGYWVFTGHDQPAQRPSWNYRAEDGGGIIDDMFSHWSYVLENLFGRVESVTCLGKTHIPRRVDEQGNEYEATAEDAAYAILELEGDIVAQINSSWTVRVNRDDLLEIQVDGTEGSAVAGLRECKTQHRANTPKPEWNPDTPTEHDFTDDWERVPDNGEFENAFKRQWAEFIRHVVADEPFPWDFRSGARGVQLTEASHRSWDERRRVELDELPV